MPSLESKRIFDCFIFFNELDLLELRLEEHFDYVNWFVLCEAPVNFRGAPKPLVFAENKPRFQKYLHKVQHIIVDDMPKGDDPWKREFHQRSALKRGLIGLNPQDIVIVSDCDELVNRAAFTYLRENDGYFLLDMPMYQFYVNMMALRAGWSKVFAYSYAARDGILDFNKIRQQPSEAFAQFSGTKHRISPGGWHFTFLGGIGKVTEKLRAYSHTEAWQQSMLRPGGAERQMQMLRDVGGGSFLKYCDIDESFPVAVRRNLQRLKNIGFVKDATSRVEELQTLVAELANTSRDQGDKNRYLTTELERLYPKSPRDVNIAMGKPATQSSVSRWSRAKTKEEDAKGGNDGKLTGLYGFHTNSELNPWWQVDLAGIFILDEIRIFNRPDQPARLRHFSVWISLDGQAWSLLYRKCDDEIFGMKMEPYIIQLLPGSERCRYVRIQLDGTGFLHFDECLIFGHDSTAEARIMAATNEGLQGGTAGNWLCGDCGEVIFHWNGNPDLCPCCGSLNFHLKMPR